MTSTSSQTAHRDILAFKYTMAKKLIREHRYAEALGTLTELQKALPKDREIQYGRASCLFHVKQYRESWRLCEAVLRDGDDARVQRLKSALLAIDREQRAAAGAKSRPDRKASAAGSPWDQRRIRRLAETRMDRDAEALTAEAFADPRGDALARENAAIRDECDRLLAAVAGYRLSELQGLDGCDGPVTGALKTLWGSRGSTRIFGVPQGENPYLSNIYCMIGICGGNGATAIPTTLGQPVIQCGYVLYGVDFSRISTSTAPSVASPAAVLAGELFWPHGPDLWFDPLRRAGSLLSVDAISGYANRAASADAVDRILGMHGVAVLCHNLAVAMEYGNAAGLLGSIDVCWNVALGMWARVLRSEIFWRYVFKRGRDLGVTPLSSSTIHAARVDATRVVAGVSRAMAGAYFRAGADLSAIRQLAYLERAGLATRVVAPGLHRLVREAYW